jgi:hypothetical protein
MGNRAVAAEKALYLYGVSPAGAIADAKITSPGIDGVHGVERLSCGEFVCWASAVDAASFGKALESNMENLDWLALHGVRHQQVVGEIARQESIIPARFGTIFSGKDALLKDVEGRREMLKRVLAKITDSDEWGVKVYAERKAAPAAMAASSGRDYLQQKSARLKTRPERDDAELKEFAEALSKVAADSAPTGKISGAQPDLSWQATFLVPRKRRKEWDGVLKKFVERWSGMRRIEVNGPWPPYSFVSDAD